MNFSLFKTQLKLIGRPVKMTYNKLTHVQLISINQIFKNMKIFVLILCLLALTYSQRGDVQSQIIVQKPAQIVMQVGQITPGKINLDQSKQQIHYFKTGKVEKKYLFVRLTTFDKVRHSLGIYNNQTRDLVYACEDNIYDSCFVPTSKLAENTTYAILIVAMENMQYNIYTYWGDLQHLKPDSQIKFTFNKQDLTQLFHLQFVDKQFKQIRIIMKPQAARSHGDAVKIFANLGFSQEPTMQKHQFVSQHVWDDAEAIILSKQQVGTYEGIGIYIVGDTQTVYTLNCQFVTEQKHEININQTINEYLAKNKQAHYLISFKQNQGVDTYTLKFSAFTGQVSVDFFYDKQLQQPFNKQPFQYMNDIQFYFSKSDFEDRPQKQLHMKVKSYDHQATYQVGFFGRVKQIAYEIHQNVFQFISVKPPKQAMYFYAHIWHEIDYQQSLIYKYDISRITIFGNPTFEYYLCKQDADQKDCKDVNSNNFEKSVEKINPINTQSVGSKVISTLEINTKKFKTINNVQKRVLVIVLVKTLQNERTAVAVQYSNPNNVRLLRQGRAFEDKVFGLERKYYKYVNNNPKIEQIRIHINQITGLTKIRAKRQKIQQPGGDQIKMSKTILNTIIVKDRITQPVYIQVLGLVNSLYTVSVSAVHSEHKMTNALVMAEDIQYQVKLQPYKTIYLQLHPVSAAIQFSYYVQGSTVTLCQVNSKNICIDAIQSSSHGNMYIDSSQSREVRIMIKNQKKADFDSQLQQDYKLLQKDQDNEPTKKKKSKVPQLVRNAKLTLMYHSAGVAHCDEKRLNKVYSQTVPSGQCFIFHLPLATDMQIMFGKSQIGIAYQQFYLCQKKIKPAVVNDRFMIPAQSIRKNCQKSDSGMSLKLLVISKNPKVTASLKIDFSVQYNNDTVTVADGVGYVAKGVCTNPQNPQRTFFYQVLDQGRDINVLIWNKKGNMKFFADFALQSERYFGNVTQGRAKFSSDKSNYHFNPYLKITPSDIKAGKCGKNCILVISVYSDNKVGDQLEYILQVTQNHIQLRQDQIKADFLSKGSIRFYQYQTRKQRGSVLFKVSDGNRGCGKAYMSKYPFPSQSSSMMKQIGGVILFDKTQKQIYYFAVEATQDCSYTVMCSEREAIITKIQYGQVFDLKIQEGLQKWFFVRHNTNSPLKIIFIKEHGQIQIFANQTDLDRQTLKSIQDNSLDKGSFAFKSSYKNTLTISPQAKQFCKNCYYLICIQATSLTQGSLFVSSQNTKIDIIANKIIYDQLNELTYLTFGKFYSLSNGTLQMKVHSGKVKFQMSYREQKFLKQYPEDKKVYRDDYKFSVSEQYGYQPISVTITPLQVPALYSFQLKPVSNVDFGQNKVTVIAGQQTIIYLSQTQQACFEGKLTRMEQQIFMSTPPMQGYMLQNIKLNVTVDEKQLQNFDKQLVGNIMSLKLNSKERYFKQVKNYKICMKYESINETVLVITIFQNQNVNLIKSNTQVLVRSQSKFVLYPQSDFILDLFQCRGTAQLYYGDDIQNIRTKQSHKLDSLGIPGQSHAVKLTRYGTFYVDVVSNLSTLLWMPIDEKAEKGIGYFKYSIGSLQYKSRFNNIQFLIGGVYRAKQTKTIVESVKYTVIITNNKQTLKQAVMCQKYATSKLVSVTFKTTSVGESPSYQLGLTLEKSKITNTFTQNEALYFNVVAQMVLRPPQSKTSQNYKFIYYEQVVPAQVFRQNKVQSMQLTLLIILALVSVVGFILISCIFVRCIVPAIGRLKNRVLVQEKDQKDISIPVPQSSDRNQIPGVPAATDEKLS